VKECTVVPDPADHRRLYAYGDYTPGPPNDIGRWTLSDGFSAHFRASFDETATLAGSALNPPPAVQHVRFWLHSLFLHLLEVEKTRDDRGYLGIGDRQHGIIRDVCRASAMYCSALAKVAMEREPKDFERLALQQGAEELAQIRSSFPVLRRQTKAAEIEPVRIRARQMLAEGATHQAVCQRLKDAVRPPRAEWRHLPWDKAYLEPRYRSAVCKWLSRNCKP
jgi:hypothetical protein